MQGQLVEQGLDDGHGHEVPPAVQQHAAPAEARLVLDDPRGQAAASRAVRPLSASWIRVVTP